jgi:hypothetical protein
MRHSRTIMATFKIIFDVTVVAYCKVQYHYLSVNEEYQNDLCVNRLHPGRDLIPVPCETKYARDVRKRRTEKCRLLIDQSKTNCDLNWLNCESCLHHIPKERACALDPNELKGHLLARRLDKRRMAVTASRTLRWLVAPVVVAGCACVGMSNIFFSVAQQPNSGLGRLVVKVSRSHTIRYTQPVGLPWTSDQLIAEAATYTTNTRDKHPCSEGVSNPQSHQSSGRQPTP